MSEKLIRLHAPSPHIPADVPCYVAESGALTLIAAGLARWRLEGEVIEFADADKAGER